MVPADVRPNIWVRWFAPDLALTLALVAMLALFFACTGGTSLFGDTDAGWHIRNGERILATGTLPQSDPWSFSKPGQPWVAWEWGADVLMGAVDRGFGLAGVAVFYGLAIAAAVWMWFRLNRAVEGNALFACLIFVPMLTTTALHWLARPHLFSWLFLLGTVWLCERMPPSPGWRLLTGIALGAALWSNLHASFFLAPLIALIYAGGTWLKPIVWEGKPDQGRRTWSGYVLAALAASAGTLLNPNGWKLHQHVVAYLTDSALLGQISEFQSFNFLGDGAVRVMLVLAICFAGAFAALAAGKPERFLLSLLLIAMALRSVRALPLAALLVTPLANGSITAVLSAAQGLRPGFRRRLDQALRYGDGLLAIDRRVHGFALVPVVSILIFTAVRTDAGFAPAEAPVAASNAVAGLPPGARVLTTDVFGGYLIYRFNGERKVFFDGRSDFYGRDFMDRYLRLTGVRPGWRGEFNRWNFSNALLPPDCALLAALEREGWRELYRDRTAVLLAGRSPI